MFALSTQMEKVKTRVVYKLMFALVFRYSF